jgi:isocitrate/isopropylmalate dehydrogenase
MILAGAALLHYAAELGHRDAEPASAAIYESVLAAVDAGTSTADLGGHASTTEFTDEVIRRVRRHLS